MLGNFEIDDVHHMQVSRLTEFLVPFVLLRLTVSPTLPQCSVIFDPWAQASLVMKRALLRLSSLSLSILVAVALQSAIRPTASTATLSERGMGR